MKPLSSLVTSLVNQVLPLALFGNLLIPLTSYYEAQPFYLSISSR